MKRLILSLALLAVPFFVFGRGYEVEYEVEYLNGDTTLDGAVCFDDSLAILFYLWGGGPDLECLSPADVDRSGVVGLEDAILGLRHVFLGAEIQDCWVTCGRVGSE
jgi:hypothetical protein